jgi:hypothetical protein
MSFGERVDRTHVGVARMPYSLLAVNFMEVTTQQAGMLQYIDKVPAVLRYFLRSHRDSLPLPKWCLTLCVTSSYLTPDLCLFSLTFAR